MTTNNAIDELISKQVSSGFSSSKTEAEQQLMANLVERKIARRLALLGGSENQFETIFRRQSEPVV